jgi:acyl carrier protein
VEGGVEVEQAGIDARLRALLAGRLRLEPAEIADDASLRDLGVDSAALLNVVVGIEEVFGIDVYDDDVTLDNFGTLAAMRGYVARRRS